MYSPYRSFTRRRVSMLSSILLEVGRSLQVVSPLYNQKPAHFTHYMCTHIRKTPIHNVMLDNQLQASSVAR